MKPRRILPYLLAAAMMLSLLPLAALPASADVSGLFDTYIPAEQYEESESGSDSRFPAAGYTYTDDGFHTISPDYAGCGRLHAITQTRDRQPLKEEGLYLEVRVDEFPYGAEDHWVSFYIWDAEHMSTGSSAYGSGWQCLIRGAGGGTSALCQTHIATADEGEKKGSYAFKAQNSVTPAVDEDGREHYILTVAYEDDAYLIKVNDTEIAAMEDVDKMLKGLSPAGEFYVGFVMYATQETAASLTITKFGTDSESAFTPTGSDAKAPEENVNVPIADIKDPSTIPENTPALRWDASTVASPSASGMSATAQGDGSYHCVSADEGAWLLWSVDHQISYDAKDFPVVAMLLHDYYGDSGCLYYCAGKTTAPSGSDYVAWYPGDEDDRQYANGDDDYLLVVMDLSDLWSGRIHEFRVDFKTPDYEDEVLGQFDFLWLGTFRSVEEAYAYADAEMAEKDVARVTEVPTEAPTDAPTAAPTGAPAEVPTEAPTGSEGAPAEPKQDSGCSSALGASVAVLTAAAAAAALRRKRDAL